MGNTKYISSSVLKTSEFSRVRSENSGVFNSRDEKILAFTTKKVNFIFILYFLYRLHAISHTLKKKVMKMKNRKFLANPNKFGTKIFVTFKLRKRILTLDVFVHK